jgi:hypothetical protein
MRRAVLVALVAVALVALIAALTWRFRAPLAMDWALYKSLKADAMTAGRAAGAGNAAPLAPLFADDIHTLRKRVLAKFAPDGEPTVATWLAMRKAISADGRLGALVYFAYRKQYGTTRGPFTGGMAVAYPPGLSPGGGEFKAACGTYLVNLLLPVRPEFYTASGNDGTELFCKGAEDEGCSATCWGRDRATGKFVQVPGATTCLPVSLAKTLGVVSSDGEFDVWIQNQAGFEDSALGWYMTSRLFSLLLLGETEGVSLSATMDPTLDPGAGLVPTATLAELRHVLSRNWTWSRGQPLLFSLDVDAPLEGFTYMWLASDEVLNILDGADTKTTMAAIWKDAYASQVYAAGYSSTRTPADIALLGL